MRSCAQPPCDIAQCDTLCRASTLPPSGAKCTHYSLSVNAICVLYAECELTPHVDYTTYSVSESCTKTLSEGGCPNKACDRPELAVFSPRHILSRISGTAHAFFALKDATQFCVDSQTILHVRQRTYDSSIMLEF